MTKMPESFAADTDDAQAERVRLERLRELFILDSAPEPFFDAIARMASDICGSPIALISLVDEQRQWFKANVGLPGVNETPRDIAFCAHAIRSDDIFEVPDATADARFADNPLVVGQPDIRFYAGAPLVMPEGERVGTLCVIDRETRQLGAEQLRLLRSLADIATQALTMRRDLVARSLKVRTDYERALSATQDFLARTGRVAGVGGWELDLTTQALKWSDETRRIHEVPHHFEPTLENAIAFYTPEARPLIEAAVARGKERGDGWDLELQLVTAKGRLIWVRAVGEVEYEAARPVRLIGAFQDITQRKALEQRVADSDRFVRTVTDSLPIRIAYVDRDRRYRFVNLAHVARYGRDRGEILGRTRQELKGGPPDPAIDAIFEAAFAGEVQRFESEESINGALRRIESQLIPDRGPDGEVRGLFTTGTDITERSASERALRELATIFDNTTDFVVQANAVGEIRYMNPAVRRALGLSLEEPVQTRRFDEFNTAETNRRFAELVVPALRTRDVWVGDNTVVLAGGRTVAVSQMVMAHRGANGKIERYSSVMRDISVEAQARQALQRQAATLRAMTEALPVAVALVGADLRYRFVNSGFERWYGAARDTIVGRHLVDVLGEVEFERSRPAMLRVLAGEAVSFEKEYDDARAVKHLAIDAIPMWAENGEVDGFVAVARDVTQHRQEQGRLLQLSRRDVLTGLLNRAGLQAFVDASLAAGEGPSLALLYVDLDHFKPVNDTYGHPVGDELLQKFANRLLELVRPTDAVGRLGGDEFAVVLRGVRERVHAHAVAEKLVRAAARPFDIGGRSISVGASVGVACGVAPETGWLELAARADAMLYGAKGAGRGRVASEPDAAKDD